MNPSKEENAILVYCLPGHLIEIARTKIFKLLCNQDHIVDEIFDDFGLKLFFNNYQSVRKAITKRFLEIEGEIYFLHLLETPVTIHGIADVLTESELKDLIRNWEHVRHVYRERKDARHGKKETDNYRVILSIPDSENSLPQPYLEVFERRFQITHYCRHCLGNGHPHFLCDYPQDFHRFLQEENHQSCPDTFNNETMRPREQKIYLNSAEAELPANEELLKILKMAKNQNYNDSHQATTDVNYANKRTTRWENKSYYYAAAENIEHPAKEAPCSPSIMNTEPFAKIQESKNNHQTSCGMDDDYSRCPSYFSYAAVPVPDFKRSSAPDYNPIRTHKISYDENQNMSSYENFPRSESIMTTSNNQFFCENELGYSEEEMNSVERNAKRVHNANKNQHKLNFASLLPHYLCHRAKELKHLYDEYFFNCPHEKRNNSTADVNAFIDDFENIVAFNKGKCLKTHQQKFVENLENNLAEFKKDYRKNYSKFTIPKLSNPNHQNTLSSYIDENGKQISYTTGQNYSNFKTTNKSNHYSNTFQPHYSDTNREQSQYTRNKQEDLNVTETIRRDYSRGNGIDKRDQHQPRYHRDEKAAEFMNYNADLNREQRHYRANKFEQEDLNFTETTRRDYSRENRSDKSDQRRYHPDEMVTEFMNYNADPIAHSRIPIDINIRVISTNDHKEQNEREVTTNDFSQQMGSQTIIMGRPTAQTNRMGKPATQTNRMSKPVSQPIRMNKPATQTNRISKPTRENSAQQDGAFLRSTVDANQSNKKRGFTSNRNTSENIQNGKNRPPKISKNYAPGLNAAIEQTKRFLPGSDTFKKFLHTARGKKHPNLLLKEYKVDVHTILLKIAETIKACRSHEMVGKGDRQELRILKDLHERLHEHKKCESCLADG